MQSEFEAIAQRDLILCNKEGGQDRPITIRIGSPYWTEAGIEAACPVAIDGLLERRQDIRGSDGLSALKNALAFVESFLSKSPEAEKICWPSGESYFE